MSMNKQFYKEPPRIPGIVYQAKSFLILILLLALAGLLMLLMEGDAFLVGLFALIASIFSYIEHRNSVKSVYLNEATVTIRYNNGSSVVNLPLSSLFLLIKEARKSKATAQNYAYDVCLAKKGRITNINPLNTFKINDQVYPLAIRITCPKNLKEWVEAFQAQIHTPLEVVFLQDHILKDYQTGEYMSSGDVDV